MATIHKISGSESIKHVMLDKVHAIHSVNSDEDIHYLSWVHNSFVDLTYFDTKEDALREHSAFLNAWMVENGC